MGSTSEYISMEVPILTIKNVVIEHYFNDNKLEYFNGDQPESFARKLKLLLDDPLRMEKIKMATVKINKRMNWNIEKIKYQNIVRNLLGMK